MIKKRAQYVSEVVNVTTLDNITREEGINHIDILKIDTEGFDLEVLKGVRILLSLGKSEFIFFEVGFHPKEDKVLFDEVRNLLIENGYFTFGIYHQTTEWSGERKLRYADVVFSKNTLNTKEKS